MENIRLDLPAYDRAMGDFVGSVFRGLARHDDLIGQIRERPTVHAGPMRNVPGPQPLDQSMSSLQQAIPIHFDVIRQGQIEEFLGPLVQAANDFIAQLQKLLIQTMSDVADATGNVLDAKGEVLTFDHIIEVIESLEISSDEDGNLNVPQMVVHPDMAERIQKLEVTPAQKKRLNDVLRRKAEENLARRRVRRLRLEGAPDA